jgi:hypothetical protein
MFYGAIIPPEEKDAMDARKTAAMETCGLLRNPEKNGTELVTFGEWRIKDPINLVLFVDPNKEYKKPYLQKAVTCCGAYIAGKSTDNAERIQKELAFFADKFAKDVKKDETYDYMISALLTKKLLTLKKHNIDHIDGVLYPSVQANGDGLCVAISTNAADKKLELIHVRQCRLTKNGMEANLEEIKQCEVNPPNSDFQLKPCKLKREAENFIE